MTFKQFCRKYYDHITGWALYMVAATAILDTFVFHQGSVMYNVMIGFAIASAIASTTCYFVNDEGRG